MLPQIVKLNREGWLTELARQVEPMFTKKGFNLGSYRVTCGWPSRGGVGATRRVLGECHGIKSSSAGVSELFITPLLDDLVEVSGTLAHEMAHIAAGVGAGHGKKYLHVCNNVGLLKGKATQAMPGEAMEAELAKIMDRLGAYPHQRMQLIAKAPKPASSFRVKCVECGCAFSMSIKWIEAAGLPTCGCGGFMTLPEE